MPDAGGFETGMSNRHDGWGDAFAALPQVSPDAGGWQRVQARLPMAKAAPRARWPLWWATAASLAIAMALPLRMLPQAGPATHAPALPHRVATATPAVAVATPITPVPIAAASSAVGEAQPVSTPIVRRGDTRRTPPSTPSQRPIRTAAQPADATRIAASKPSASADLETLYAQSAQLESLLAMARDDRVASGTRAALGDELDGRMAAIDATLIQPGLSDAQRTDLWSQRVDALQQLVGIETTNRLYAARGQSHDAALVSID